MKETRDYLIVGDQINLNPIELVQFKEKLCELGDIPQDELNIEYFFAHEGTILSIFDDVKGKHGSAVHVVS